MKRVWVSPQVQSRAKCLVDGCDRPEELAGGRSAGGLCSGHRYRKKRGLDLEPPLHEGLAKRRSPRRALIEVALQLGDVATESDSDAEFRRGVDRLTHAALRYWAARRKAPSK